MRLLFYALLISPNLGCRADDVYSNADIPEGDASPDVRDPDGSLTVDTDGVAVECQNNTIFCAEECVSPLTDPRHCGDCHRACAEGEVCEGGTCQSVSDCHEASCTGLTYCDLATGLCMPGCATNEQCGEAEACDIATHECVCIESHHRCSGVCVSDASPTTCGDRCTPCPAPEHGSGTCSAGSCGTVCDDGYQLCGSLCLPDDFPAECIPGTFRYCSATIYGRWGVQQCDEEGSNWETCSEIEIPDGCVDGDYWYSPPAVECCVEQGLCCQDQWDLDEDDDRWDSLGDCDGIAC